MLLSYALLPAVLVGLLVVAYVVAPRGVKAVVRSVGRLVRAAGRSRRRVVMVVAAVSALVAAAAPAYWSAGLVLLCAGLAAAATDRRPSGLDDPAVLVTLATAAATPAAVAVDRFGLLPGVPVADWLPLVAAGSVLAGATAGACAGWAGRRGARGPRLDEAHVALGVTAAAAEAAHVRVRRTRDGRVHISPVPPEARVRSDVQDRVAQVWPGWAVESLSARELVLARESTEAAEQRQLLAATDGLVAAIGPVLDPPVWRPGAMRLVGPGAWRGADVALLEDLAADRGLTLVELDLERGAAVAAAISGRMVALRRQVADLMGWRPSDVELSVEVGQDERPSTVTVHRAPVLAPEKRTAAWTAVLQDALPAAAGEVWTLVPTAGALRLERRVDPLAGLFRVDAAAAVAPGAVPVVTVGRAESGEVITLDLAREACHVALQGMTRSGKSVLTYNVLTTLAASDSVAVYGCDPSGILLAPFTGTRHGDRVAVGTAEPARFVAALQSAVTEMDRRTAELGRALTADKIDKFTSEQPLMLVVCEEMPGIVKALKGADASAERGAEKLESAFKLALSRLLAEGAKVGVRCLLIAQRFDTASAIDGGDRANVGCAITFRVKRPDAIAMLHETLPAGVSPEQVGMFQPGVGLYENAVTGRDVTRFRAPLIEGGFAAYAQAIRAANPVLDTAAPDVLEEVELDEMVLTWDDLEGLDV